MNEAGKWDVVLKGLVLRAQLCPRCKKVLPVACDEAETVHDLRVTHLKGGEHHVYLRQMANRCISEVG